jgi:hypothetical protein
MFAPFLDYGSLQEFGHERMLELGLLLHKLRASDELSGEERHFLQLLENLEKTVPTKDLLTEAEMLLN